MNEETFKQKSIVKYKSPENLNEYIRVSNPSVWVILVSILILLAGTIIWILFGHIDSIAPSIINVNNGKAVCYVDKEYTSSVDIGMEVKFKNYTGIITDINENNDSVLTCNLSCNIVPKDDIYDGKIILKSYKPISFVVN